MPYVCSETHKKKSSSSSESSSKRFLCEQTKKSTISISHFTPPSGQHRHLLSTAYCEPSWDNSSAAFQVPELRCVSPLQRRLCAARAPRRCLPALQSTDRCPEPQLSDTYTTATKPNRFWSTRSVRAGSAPDPDRP